MLDKIFIYLGDVQWKVEYYVGITVMVGGILLWDSNIALLGWLITSVGMLGMELRGK